MGPTKLVECVPNFSEGRDVRAIDAIRNAMSAVPGVVLLRSEQDPDHHRSVMTLAGEPEAVLEAAYSGVAEAARWIDLTRHAGVHPRIGATDVVPFVPVDGVSLEDCAQLAWRLGERVWHELRIPVYFYEAAARHADRKNLEKVRRGGFENPSLRPDLGGPDLHPTAGACVIGARPFLIAFNIDLNTPDLEAAKAIARKIRASSGGMADLKAIGVPLVSRNLVQVSMNLTNFERTGLYAVFERVRQEAAAMGISLAGSEIVGLVPKKALEAASAEALQVQNFSSDLVFENRLRSMLAQSPSFSPPRSGSQAHDPTSPSSG